MDSVFLLSPLPFLPLPFTLSPPLPLEVGTPLNQLEGLWSSPNGVRGTAPAKNEFNAL